MTLTLVNFLNNSAPAPEPAPAPKPDPAPPAPVPAPPAAPAVKAEAALGSVKGTASGGQKLEKETLAEGTLDFLKNYN